LAFVGEFLGAGRGWTWWRIHVVMGLSDSFCFRGIIAGFGYVVGEVDIVVVEVDSGVVIIRL